MTIDRELMRLIRIREAQRAEALAVQDRSTLLAHINDLEQELAETAHATGEARP